MCSFKLLRNLLKLKSAGLALFATVYEIIDHEWMNGKLVCPHEGYTVTIQQHVNGKLVGELKIKTCIADDPGA